MRKLFYPKLAANNIKKNYKTYIPYIITCVITIAMYYIMQSLAKNNGIGSLVGDASIQYMMKLGCRVIAIFAVIFLFYTNSFLMKRRKKEFGVFNILGMEKKHLSRVMFYETLYIAAGSMAAGVFFGIILDKVMYLVIMKLMGSQVPLGFYIAWEAMLITAKLFGIIFLLLFIYSLFQIRLSKPIELIKGGNVGEKEPKAKWLIALLGLICLAIGYFIAVTTKNPVAAILLFFVAVILVIVGTYLLFTAGSIVLLKLLRTNKKYYYKANHFVSISGMIYRMKQNAVGLASICILSTMVLVMVSSTSSMMIGLDSIMTARFPYDMALYYTYDSEKSYQEGMVESGKITQNIDQWLTEKGTPATASAGYTYLAFAALQQQDFFSTDLQQIDSGLEGVSNLFVVSLDEYNRVTGADKSLSSNEIMVIGNRKAYDYDQLKVFDKSYDIKERPDEFLGNGFIAANAVKSYFIVVDSEETIVELYQLQKEAYGDNASGINYCYGFNLNADDDTQIQIVHDLYQQLAESGDNVQIDSRANMHVGMMSLYGGLFFMGIFLGVLFVMATVLIIYYKQITEGYEDKQRFEIMQKVGMSHEEVKRSIRSQILTVFFLPLFMAGIHIIFAFPIIREILKVLNLTDVKLYIMCTVGCFAIFSAMYVLIYALTAKAYYRIVKR